MSGAASRQLVREILFESGDEYRAPMFADASTSIVVTLGARSAMARGLWLPGDAPEGHIIGPMTTVGGPAPTEHAAMVGVYLRPTRAALMASLPGSELTNRVLPLTDVWGQHTAYLPLELAEASETERVERLESELMRYLGGAPTIRTSIDVSGLAAWALRARGRLSVRHMAQAAGVSRQHLTRVFTQVVGVSPKQYCRLARFQAALGYAGAGDHVDWSRAAAALGYADQSHMIAEFRRFSSLTPGEIAGQRVFHPFIEKARADRQSIGHRA